MPKWLHPNSYQGVFLFVHDVVAIVLSIYIVSKVRIDYPVNVFEWELAVVILITVLTLYSFNTYHFSRTTPSARLAIRTFAAVVVSGLLIATYVYLAKATTSALVFWRGNLPTSLFLFGLWSSITRYVANILYTRNGKVPRWLFIGRPESAEMLIEDHARSSTEGVIDAVEVEGNLTAEYEIVTREENLVIKRGSEQLYSNMVAGIIIDTLIESPKTVVNNLLHTRLSGIQVCDIAEFYEQRYRRIPVFRIVDSWLVVAQGFSLLHHDIQLKIKRLLDLFVSSILLVLTSPLIAVVGFSILILDGYPVFYTQERVGKNGQIFRIYKFRTMRVSAEEKGSQWADRDDPRVTRLGKYLRKFRLDELPQILNIIKGDMSFVGPRPEREEFVKLLAAEIPYYELRELVKPGLSGWAQVMYPYGASVEDAKNKLEYDLYYIKNYSLAFDLYVVLRTIRAVFTAQGR